MEIPPELKSLYKHWAKHASTRISFNNTLKNNRLLQKIEVFATERMQIWDKKYRNTKPPYTDDPILAKYRFCNMYRELDRQTIEIHNSLKQFESNFELWLLNLAFERFIVNPETVTQVGFLSFDPVNNKKVYRRLKELSSPKYGTAYIFPINIIQKSDYPTREDFLTKYLPLRMKQIAELIKNFDNFSVNKALNIILPEFGFNFRFHWTEILIDVAYQYPYLIDLYEDFYIGPGALPTLKRFEKDVSIEDFVKTKLAHFPYLEYFGKPVYLSVENWEGVFCEFRKYSNLKAGKGRRRRFG